MTTVPLKIAIIGAGFSGTALTAMLAKLSGRPIEIILFDKAQDFGAGDAYRTPFSFHLLNVRAKDMSAFEDEPLHFVNWLTSNSHQDGLLDDMPLAEQFVPRRIYRHYLQDLLNTVKSNTNHHISLKQEPFAVVDACKLGDKIELTISDQRKLYVDKVVLALGNNPPKKPPFAICMDPAKIMQPWDYRAPAQIDKHSSVLIVGTGLSMIDAVLTLHHHQHQGKIYAVSRHGLLPLAHTKHHDAIPFPRPIPPTLNSLTKHLRRLSKKLMAQGGDWRALITSLRADVPNIWHHFSVNDKKRFLRHTLPYWNIHRHRVHWLLADLLADLSAKHQLEIFAGHVLEIKNNIAKIRLRHRDDVHELEANYIINCMGPSLTISSTLSPLIYSLMQRGFASLDALKLGLAATTTGALKESSGQVSSCFYTLGALRRGELWEISAVPEIRKQVFDLAQHLLA